MSRAEPFLRITEIFHSIQGESTWAGAPCTFVRLTGCPLRSVWCDTEYAFLGGERMTLDVPGAVEHGQYMLVFADATSGSETYGGGRYLWVDGPDEQGRVVMDFNYAYNPPCVWTPFATCPLPTRDNRLPIRVEAGEKNWTH